MSDFSRLESLTHILEVKENNRQKVLDFMAHAPCICFMKSTKTGAYEFVNNAMCDVVGKSRDEIIGKTDLDLFPLEEAALRTSYDLRVLKDRHPIIYISKRGHDVFIFTKFLVINGEESIGCFGLELPALFYS